ncbi:MAG TPA: replicative DNA helicase [Clostridiales bacterium]|jgi:replicative DNA helicase|nr:replicative DNA helicase [Clostridiales bacterium]
MADEQIVKRLPYSLEAEQSVLGSILIDPERFTQVATILTSEDFYIEEHKSIYEAMASLFLVNKSIDVVTLINELVKLGVYTDESGRNYIRVIAEAVPTAQNILDYARIVKDKSTLRRLIEACAEITENAFAEGDEVDNIVNNAEQKIFAIAQGSDQKNFTHIKEVIISVYDHLQLLESDRAAAVGTPSGFTELDRVIVGMAPSDLILIGARPGMGKTSFALNIAVKAARATKKAICIFSLEMSKQQLATRMLSSEGLIDNYALRTGALDDRQWAALANTAAMLSECEILIDDTSGITITGMKAKLRRVKNLGLVIIDYLQLMTSDRRIDNRVQEVSDISRNLKLLAKDLGVPVICCAQLSRAPEGRSDKIPQLSDLRDSGAIEQDADIVMFLYRAEYYKEEAENQNFAEVIIAKNRHGSTGRIKMGWWGQYTRFTDLNENQDDQDGGKK